MLGGGDLLQAGPGRHAVDLEHRRPLVAVVEDVDAGEIRADRRGGAHRQRLGVVVRHHRHRPAAALDVGDPVGASGASSRRPRGRATPAGENRGSRRARRRRTAGDSTRRRCRPAAAARPRVRISRRPRPCEPNSGLSTSGPRAASRRDDRARGVEVLHRPGVRRRDAGAREQEARHRLVDAALDRARVVPHHDAELAQRMQDAEPHRHRLEAAARDGADQHGVGQPIAEAVEIEARRRCRSRTRRPRAASRPATRPRRAAPLPARGNASRCDRPRCRRARGAGLARQRISRTRHRACPH